MLRARPRQVSQIEDLLRAVGAIGKRNAALFANLPQGKGPKIFEKTGIGHQSFFESGGRYFFGAAGGGAFMFILKPGIF
jgi:hypothetical protein